MGGTGCCGHGVALKEQRCLDHRVRKLTAGTAGPAGLLLSGTGNCNHLASLQVDAIAPTSPCPADLRSLDLSDNRFTSLPDATSVATGLTSLCLKQLAADPGGG